MNTSTLNNGDEFDGVYISSSGKKYDLTKWKYADLRHAINNETDKGLLQACRQEFDRRLKGYHAWKTENTDKKKGAAVTNSASKTSPNKKKANDNRGQRYFRIPLAGVGEGTNKKAWWYAHFDGQWVARQMEVHPKGTPS